MTAFVYKINARKRIYHIDKSDTKQSTRTKKDYLYRRKVSLYRKAATHTTSIL